MSKLLTVFGATGNQGGSVVRTVLSHPELSKTFKVRAVTRDPTKANAQALKDLGAEVVKGDQNDEESVKAAIRGSYAVFGVTNFWEGMSGASEETQGKTMADAAVAEGVTQFIFSSLPHTSRVTDGKLKHISHFEHKANVESHVKTLAIKSAFYWPAFFMSNFQQSFGPQKGPDGTYTLTNNWSPDTKVPLIDIAADTGKFIVPLLQNPDAWNHKRIYGAAAFYTPAEIAATFEKVKGVQVKAAQIPDDMFKSFLPEAIAQEMTENMMLIRDYKYFGPEGKGAEAELEESLKALDEKPVSFEEFVKKSTWTQF